MSRTNKKKTKITTEIRDKIENMVLEGISDGGIAEELDLDVNKVATVRLSLGIHRNESSYNTVSAANKPKDFNERVQRWRLYFKSQDPRYSRLKQNLTPKDLDFFVDQWAQYHAQLEDMENSEEDSLEILILHQIRINENQRNFKALQENEDRLKKMLQGRDNQELDLENENDRFIFEMLMSNNSMKQQVNKELKELSDRYDKILQTLNATRQQREDKHKIGGDTFLSLIRSFRDDEFRRGVNKYNERMRIATNKQIEKFKKSHEFVDGTVEPIMLDGKDFIKE